MKKIFILIGILVLSAGAMFAQGGKMASSSTPVKNGKEVSQGKTLYQRLGGYDALAAVSDDFIGRLATGKLLSRFVVGLSDDSKKKLRGHLVDFLCVATGGPCVYTGRDMKMSHTGLGITEADWKEAVDDLVGTLDKFKVPAKEKGEVLGAVSGLKKDIVEKP